MELDIFIEGETVDLRIPTLEFVEKSDWYKWFNNPHVTRFLEHGIFPNTRDKQVDFFLKEREKRLLLIITDKKMNIIGTTTIANIDYKNSSGGLAIVMSNIFRKNPLESLEAVSLITEHTFLKLGLKRIIASQHIGLIPWSHRMSLLGYRLEGIEKNGFVKGVEIADVLKIACHYEDYQKIAKNRGGSLWDSQEKMLKRIKTLPKQSMHMMLQEFFRQSEEYYNQIFLS